MPRVEFLIYSDGVQVESLPGPNGVPQQRILVQNPQYVLRPLFVPSLFSFTISFAISDLDTSIPNSLRLTFVFADQPDTIIFDSGVAQLASIVDEQSDMPEHLRGFNANVDVRNIPIRQNGRYQSEIFINGESIGVFPVEVWRKEG